MPSPSDVRAPDATSTDQRAIRWGLGDVVIGFFAGQILSIIAYGVVIAVHPFATGGAVGPGGAFGQVVGHLATGQAPAYEAPIPLWLQFLLQIPLWACLIGVPLLVTTTKGNGPVRDLGLRFRPVDVPVGLAIGVASQFVLMPLIFWPVLQLFGDQDVSAAARELTDRATDPFGVVMLFVIVGIGVPVAEEIFFRGLTQRALTRRCGPWIALFGTAGFFALTHFELLQLPGLFAFGLMLGAMAFATGRLGTAIWAHLGFNLVAVTTLVWQIEPPLWVLAVIGVAGLAACGYLVVVWRSGRESSAEDPTRVTASY